MPQQVGAYGYAMEFPISGFEELEDRDWRVIITRPDGTSFERTGSDVELLDAVNLIMGVRIESDDHNQEGTYKLQLLDETDDAVLKSSVMEYVVLGSLTQPA